MMLKVFASLTLLQVTGAIQTGAVHEYERKSSYTVAGANAVNFWGPRAIEFDNGVEIKGEAVLLSLTDIGAPGNASKPTRFQHWSSTGTFGIGNCDAEKWPNKAKFKGKIVVASLALYFICGTNREAQMFLADGTKGNNYILFESSTRIGIIAYVMPVWFDIHLFTTRSIIWEPDKMVNPSPLALMAVDKWNDMVDAMWDAPGRTSSMTLALDEHYMNGSATNGASIFFYYVYLILDACLALFSIYLLGNMLMKKQCKFLPVIVYITEGILASIARAVRLPNQPCIFNFGARYYGGFFSDLVTNEPGLTYMVQYMPEPFSVFSTIATALAYFKITLIVFNITLSGKKALAYDVFTFFAGLVPFIASVYYISLMIRKQFSNDIQALNDAEIKAAINLATNLANIFGVVLYIFGFTVTQVKMAAASKGPSKLFLKYVIIQIVSTILILIFQFAETGNKFTFDPKTNTVNIPSYRVTTAYTHILELGGFLNGA